MEQDITFVGMDTHKASISVAMLLPGNGRPVEWQVPNEEAAIRKMAKKIRDASSGRVVCCYEAGPCGYALQRQLASLKVECQVVAPSLIPIKPGDRIKTDRRDARKLAELLRANLLTEVHPPTPSEEAVRDLCRAREDAAEDRVRCRHRITQFLLRRGLVWRRVPWTKLHVEWLRKLTWEHDAERVVFEDYLLALEQFDERLKTLESHLDAQAQREPYKEPVAWLKCFRGFQTITALGIVAELHDFRGFQTARDLMGYLGLVPSESTTSDNRRQGSITKTGNCHVRKLLVEAAWHYRRPWTVSGPLKKRREGQPASIIAIADKAGQRLHRKVLPVDLARKARSAGRHRRGARTGRLHLGHPLPAGCAEGVTAKTRRLQQERSLMGTIWGCAEFLCERPSAVAFATIDGVSPRRITVMRLCQRATRGYQDDSSSRSITRPSRQAWVRRRRSSRRQGESSRSSGSSPSSRRGSCK